MEDMSGLVVIGTISDRRKREVKIDNRLMEVISYDVIGNDNKLYYVDAFSPDVIYEREQSVQIPVYIKPYLKKDGKPSFTINQKTNSFSSNRRGKSF